MANRSASPAAVQQALPDTRLPESRPIASVDAPISVLLLDGETTHAPAVAHCLTAVQGLTLHVLSSRPRVPLRFSRRTASFHTWDGCAAPGAGSVCDVLARRLGVDVCIAAGELAQEFLVREREHIGVPCIGVPSSDSLEKGRDKWRLATFLMAHRLPHPHTVLCSAYGGGWRINEMRFPVLVKPRLGGNGIGIRRFDDAGALSQHLSVAGPWDKTIVQTLLDGFDIDCSVLCDRGEVLAYTIQRGFLGASGFRPPGGIEFVDDERVIGIVRKMMAALSWSGVAHVDLRYDSRANQLNVIEINPRFWGSVLGSLHAGVNFPYLACQAALGRPFVTPDFRRCRYVAGATALSYWSRGRISTRSTGFSFSDTAFWYVRHDPWPMLVETFIAP